MIFWCSFCQGCSIILAKPLCSNWTVTHSVAQGTACKLQLHTFEERMSSQVFRTILVANTQTSGPRNAGFSLVNGPMGSKVAFFDVRIILHQLLLLCFCNVEHACHMPAAATAVNQDFIVTRRRSLSPSKRVHTGSLSWPGGGFVRSIQKRASDTLTAAEEARIVEEGPVQA